VDSWAMVVRHTVGGASRTEGRGIIFATPTGVMLVRSDEPDPALSPSLSLRGSLHQG